MKQRTFFAFRYEWVERIAHLHHSTRLEIHEAAAHYARTGELPEMTEEAEEAFNEYLLPDFRRRAKAAEYRRRAKERKLQAPTESPEPEVVSEESGVLEKSEASEASEETEQPAEPEKAAGLTAEERRRLKRQRERRRKKARRLARRAAPTKNRIMSDQNPMHTDATKYKIDTNRYKTEQIPI